MATPQQPLEPALRPPPEAALNIPVGAASPLWFAFFGAAASASAWWWMTRWSRELASEAAAGATAAAAMPGAAVETASFAPVDDVEDAAEVVAEAVAEAAGLVIDPMIEAPVVVLPEPAFAAAAVDDLTRLVGVGPKLAAALTERGVTTFAQIAAWQGKELDEIDKALSLKGRATRDAWVSQARRLAAG